VSELLKPSLAPQFCTKEFDGPNGTSGGDCWWVWLTDKRATEPQAREWCDDNGVTLVVFGPKHFNVGSGDAERFVRWVGFVYEDDALMFYLAHA
jgi:hypothetical protein